MTDQPQPRPGPKDASTEPSYEAARAELAEVMKALESGGQSLEQSLELWRRGEELAELCQRWLDDAGRRLDEAIAARAGTTTGPGTGTGIGTGTGTTPGTGRSVGTA